MVQFASRVSSGVVGSVGLALLAWTLVGTIKKVEDSFNFLWHVEQPRSFARRLAEYTGLLIAAPVILVGFVGLLHAAFASAPVQEVVHLPLLQRLRGAGLALAPYAMVTALLHRALHDDPQHPRALARRAHRRCGRRRAVGGDRAGSSPPWWCTPRASPSCTRVSRSWSRRCCGPTSAG